MPESKNLYHVPRVNLKKISDKDPYKQKYLDFLADNKTHISALLSNAQWSPELLEQAKAITDLKLAQRPAYPSRNHSAYYGGNFFPLILGFRKQPDKLIEKIKQSYHIGSGSYTLLRHIAGFAVEDIKNPEFRASFYSFYFQMSSKDWEEEILLNVHAVNEFLAQNKDKTFGEFFANNEDKLYNDFFALNFTTYSHTKDFLEAISPSSNYYSGLSPYSVLLKSSVSTKKHKELVDSLTTEDMRRIYTKHAKVIRCAQQKLAKTLETILASWNIDEDEITDSDITLHAMEFLTKVLKNSNEIGSENFNASFLIGKSLGYLSETIEQTTNDITKASATVILKKRLLNIMKFLNNNYEHFAIQEAVVLLSCYNSSSRGLCVHRTSKEALVKLFEEIIEKKEPDVAARTMALIASSAYLLDKKKARPTLTQWKDFLKGDDDCSAPQFLLLELVEQNDEPIAFRPKEAGFVKILKESL